jgi:FMN phosphatase YigB (HAD superfamily)
MQTILFIDIDSTLVENQFSRKVLGRALGEIAALTNKPVMQLAREMGEENTRRQRVDPDNVLTMDWYDIVQTVARQYQVEVTENIDLLWQEYAHKDDVEVLDNAHQVLAELRQHGCKLVIATKGLTKYQQPVLTVTGLDVYFDDMLTPDKTGYLKTSPQYFSRYLNNGARLIQIGDHFYDDVICAKRNGFASIMRLPLPELQSYDPFERPQLLAYYSDRINTYPDDATEILLPDAVVVSLEECPDVIRRIEQA